MSNPVDRGYLRRLIEAALDPLVTISPEGKITDVNVATETITGRTRSELIGTDFSAYFTSPPDAREGYERVFRDGQVVDYPLELAHTSGHVTPVLYNASVYRDADGDVVGVFAAARDITQQEADRQKLADQAERLAQARVALEVESERLELVLAGTRLGLWDWNMITGALVMDDRLMRMMGYELQELEPISIDTWHELTDPRDLARAYALIEQHSAGTIPHYDIELRMLHRDGRWLWVRDRAKIVERTSDGRPLRMTGSIEDITELVEARNQVRAERARLRLTLDSLIDPHILLDAVRDDSGAIVDFVYTEANPAACAYNGLAYQDLVGARLLHLLPGHEAVGLLESYRRVVETGEPLVLDDVAYNQELLGGAARYYDIRAVRIDQGLSCTWRDVTDRHDLVAALAATEHQFRLLAENATDVVLVVSPDFDIVWVSPATRQILGIDPQELIGMNSAELVHPEDLPTLAGVRVSLVPGGPGVHFELRVRVADGQYRWMSGVSSAAFDADGTVIGRISTLRDIHEQVLTREALARSEQLFRLAMDGAPQGMAVVGLHLKFVQVNPVLCALLGHEEAWLLSHTLRDILPPDDLETDLAALDELVSGAASVQVREGRWRKADGSTVWVVHSIGLLRDEYEMPLFYVMHVQDNSDAHRVREELARRANHDPLTGLINREQLQAHLTHLLAIPPQPAVALAVLFCDLDYFKRVNDERGHEAGDEVLRATAHRIAAVLRLSDIAARIGGDEFVVVLDAIPDQSTAIEVAEKIREAIAKPITIDAGRSFTITASVGIALATPQVDSHRLLRNADAALYQAKNAGRDQIALFNDSATSNAET